MAIHIKLILQLFFKRWKRTLSFIIAFALLSTTVGLLGNYFLTNKDSISPLSLGFVDNDKSTLSKMALQMGLPLLKNSNFIKILEFPTTEEGEESVKQGELSGLFILPKGFLESVLSGENKPISIVLSNQNPIHGELIEFFTKDILKVLEESQIGVYSALDYTYENYPDKYDAIFKDINQRFISSALSFNSLVDKVELSTTGEVSPSIHYFFTTIIFLLLLSSALYIPFVQTNYTLFHRIELFKRKHTSLKVVGGITLGWGMWNLFFSVITTIGLYFFSTKLGYPFSFLVIFPLILSGFFIAVFGVAISFFFKNQMTGVLALCIYSGLNLFFSGGIIPLFYLKPWVEKTAHAFPSYWLTRLLSLSTLGALSTISLIYILGFLLLFLLIGLYGYNKPLKEVTP